MIGQTISHYRIQEKLGAGGMGEIYKAQDTRLNRFVAIKVLTSGETGDEERRRRFLQEAQAASALNHPNIITIYDIFSAEGRDLIVMEFIAGRTLADLIPQEGMAADKALECAVQMADALRAAHAAGIIHRDLKPGNVMVTPSGLVKILDFGLAKLTGLSASIEDTDETQPLSAPMTVEGSILGTVSYMSPEQAEGRKVDARSDIFSFGLVLYEMVTGAKAFSGASAIATLSKILRDEATPIPQVTKNVPRELDEIIRRAMRKDPGQRWQTIGEMHAALSGLRQRIQSGVLAKPALPPPARKSSAAAVAAAFVATALVLGGGGWWLTHRGGGEGAAPATARPASEPAAAPKESPPANVAPGNEAKAGANPEVIEAMRNPRGATPARTPPAGASVPASAAPAAPRTAPPPAPPPAPAEPTGRKITLMDGLPISVTLNEAVPLNPETGQALHFTVDQDFKAGDAVVVAKGTPVTGEVTNAGGERKMLIKKTKATFRVTTVDAVDGSKLAIRSLGGKRTEKPEGPIQLPSFRDKDKLAPAGAKYLVYIDGDQTVTLRK